MERLDSYKRLQGVRSHFIVRLMVLFGAVAGVLHAEMTTVRGTVGDKDSLLRVVRSLNMMHTNHENDSGVDNFC